MTDVTVTVTYGWSTVDSWLQAEATADGGIRLVGMSRTTHYDGGGNVVEDVIKETGLVATLW